MKVKQKKIAKIIPCKSLEFLKLFGFRCTCFDFMYEKEVHFEGNSYIKYVIDEDSHEIEIRVSEGDYGWPIIDDTLFKLYEAGLIEFTNIEGESDNI